MQNPNMSMSMRRMSEMETDNPFDFYRRIRGKNSCLLKTGLGRHTIIGYEPYKVLKGDGFEVLKEIESELALTEAVSDLPFCGGALGYFGYDFGLKIYGIESQVEDDIGTPEAYFCFYDKAIVFDHEKDEVHFVGGSEEDFGEGDERAEAKSSKPKSNLSKEEYVKKIAEIKKYLYDGETYQVNFSQRFECDFDGDAFDLFEKLHEVNPSPYACFFDHEDLKVISCSPERLFCVKDGKIEVRPIKGTVARRGDDEKAIAELKKSKKDDAELSMIVDLYRNDIGKVCEPGSVEVKEHRRIEKYSHVIHTVSVVEGVLNKDVSARDLVEAMFPGGSITGCPKKRTMKIINRLEDKARGVYCGSAGYFSWNGNSDFNILIRTFANKNGKLWFHGGGGIVVDSDAEKEYDETLDKVAALMEAL
jgi:para-aminobenzoate synthetase component I